MKYRIKVKQIVVIEKWFNAENDDEAMDKAQEIYLNTMDNDSEFENGVGEREYDYSLSDDNGKDLLYFDKW